MQPNRRDFLKHVGCATAAGTGLAAVANEASADVVDTLPEDPIGVLVDTTACVGCRLCEYACQGANGLEQQPLESYNDQSVMEKMRRPDEKAITVVNKWDTPERPYSSPVFAKVNCMHCNHPACASACIVGALQKKPNGAVTYDAWKCIGCRYCMVACPFQMPAYQYDNAFTPQIVKCQFCFESRTSKGEKPACVAACPRETMIFGKRSELLKLAHETIDKHPNDYVNHVYGEHEVGGTSWLYLAAVPFEQIGFLKLGHEAPPATSEKIQRGTFKYGLPPVAAAGILGAIALMTRVRENRRTKSMALRVLPGDHHRITEMAGCGTVEATPPADAPADAPAAEKPVDAPAAENAALSAEKTLEVHPAVHVEAKTSHHHDEHEHEHEEVPQPVNRPLLTPGVFILLGLIAVGLFYGLKRFIFGIGSVTNLDNQWPWGMWVGIDVASGVALAAGGFTTAALVSIFGRKKYEPLIRPALLTATLGYTIVVMGVLIDLGRYYNVWHPMIPIMWQGNSVLFQIGLCEAGILNLLWIQFAPYLIEKLADHKDRFPKTWKLVGIVDPILRKVMPLLIIIGCVLAMGHQSALGNLLVITPYKLHGLWHTPVLGLQFLISAVALGFAMVIWESLFAGWSLKLKPEMHVLTPMAKFVPMVLAIYLVSKVADMAVRGTYGYLDDGSALSKVWIIEVAFGVVIPMLMLMSKAVRRSPMLLFAAVSLVVFGVIFNRMNVFVVAFKPPYAKTYFPAVGEIAITVGLMATLMFGYRVVVTYFPIISQPKVKAAAKLEAVAA